MNTLVSLLQELLPELESYLNTTDDSRLDQFAAWLHRRTEPSEVSAEDQPLQEPDYFKRLAPLAQLPPLINRINYFIQLRAQQLLADLDPVRTQRDFVVLASIVNNQAPTKSDIAAVSLLELSTITEITRRLTQAKLVEEVPDALDRRTRRLKATPKGEQLFKKATERMEQVAPAIYEPLTVAEQTEFRRLLRMVNASQTAAFLRKSS